MSVAFCSKTTLNPHYKKLLGIEDLLDGETTSDDAEESKPEPDIFAAALEKIGSRRGRTGGKVR